MRIKIIRNSIGFNCSFINIDQYIGQVFEVESSGDDGSVNVNLDGTGALRILPDEYEVVYAKDITKELDKFMRTYYPYELEIDTVKDFILANRVELFEILR